MLAPPVFPRVDIDGNVDANVITICYYLNSAVYGKAMTPLVRNLCAFYCNFG